MNRFMEEALELAARGAGCASPNPAVGAVVVRNDEVVGRGFHTWAGVKHAEVLALEEAGDKALGSTMYVTLEPCTHHGRTPPCIDAILAAGVRKVVAPMEDPNPLVAGRGFTRLRDAGVEVELDASAAKQAVEINEAFVHFMRTGRTLVTLKAAMTLDGKIAAPDDDAGTLTHSGRNPLDHQRDSAGACATAAARLPRCDSDRHRDRPLRQLPADGSHRPAAQPSASADRAGLAAAPAAGFAPGSRLAIMTCWR